jgi:predicted phosphodiesterase
MTPRRIALISDMHGNAVGLDAVLAELRTERFDAVVCLGDVAQGGPQPAACVDRLRELGCRCVFGNSDEFLLTLDPGAEALDEERLARLVAVGEWSAQQLGRERLDFLRNFEPTVGIELDGGRSLLCFHGSPSSNEDVILPDTQREDVERMIGGRSADVFAGGHVHLQWIRRLGRSAWFCVGSAGLAYEHGVPDDELRFDPWAEFAVLTSEAGRLGVEFRRVAFDAEKVVRAYRESGMPDAERSAAMWS